MSTYRNLYKRVAYLESLLYEGKQDQEKLLNFLGKDYYDKYIKIKNILKLLQNSRNIYGQNKLESYMGVDVMHYRVAELNEKEFQAVKKVEAIMEEETGKKYVMIAWEKEEQL